jgi:hypothetical protein
VVSHPVDVSSRSQTDQKKVQQEVDGDQEELSQIAEKEEFRNLETGDWQSAHAIQLFLECLPTFECLILYFLHTAASQYHPNLTLIFLWSLRTINPRPLSAVIPEPSLRAADRGKLPILVDTRDRPEGVAGEERMDCVRGRRFASGLKPASLRLK